MCGKLLYITFELVGINFYAELVRSITRCSVHFMHTSYRTTVTNISNSRTRNVQSFRSLNSQRQPRGLGSFYRGSCWAGTFQVFSPSSWELWALSSSDFLRISVHGHPLHRKLLVSVFSVATEGKVDDYYFTSIKTYLVTEFRMSFRLLYFRLANSRL